MSSFNTTEPILEKFDKNDISRLIDLSNSVGWDYDENEVTTVMSSGRIYGHKNEEGLIVSSAAIIDYSSKLASIGMVIVREDYRGMGLGRKATEKCLESVPINTPVMLIATEEGKPMYEKMGFTSIDSVHKFLCDNYEQSITSSTNNYNIEPLSEEDLYGLINLDTEAFGVNRETFLMNRINQSKDSLVVKSPDGAVIGYGLSVKGPVNLILGPIVATDSQTALLIIDELAKNHIGKLRIDVPSGNEIFMSKLEKYGFIKVSQPPIMIKNSNELPLRNNTLYGIAAQIFG
ncbi:GNAT family N-acetyltransferase [Psychrobacillus vulpis]|uniref:GNAT family N-acetyltransferase n=1 Tax=Psychrobacillus vulpis TaxID=2325572 RepID=A0A544TRN7_9BACI|nr:GNAT family N-acetyltransferase [Psychrobacillus vulpis]TQR20105.1 GNAT family N-acetyltransferase [Psychrobacillus vulpis]